jgi:hypothetical protein
MTIGWIEEFVHDGTPCEKLEFPPSTTRGASLGRSSVARGLVVVLLPLFALAATLYYLGGDRGERLL